MSSNSVKKWKDYTEKIKDKCFQRRTGIGRCCASGATPGRPSAHDDAACSLYSAFDGRVPGLVKRKSAYRPAISQETSAARHKV